MTKEVVTTQELGGAVVHTKKSGTCDIVTCNHPKGVVHLVCSVPDLGN